MKVNQEVHILAEKIAVIAEGLKYANEALATAKAGVKIGEDRMKELRSALQVELHRNGINGPILIPLEGCDKDKVLLFDLYAVESTRIINGLPKTLNTSADIGN